MLTFTDPLATILDLADDAVISMDEDQRILGFGNKRNYVHAYDRRSGQDALEAVYRSVFEVKLRADAVFGRLTARARRTWHGLVRRAVHTERNT